MIFSFLILFFFWLPLFRSAKDRMPTNFLKTFHLFPSYFLDKMKNEWLRNEDKKINYSCLNTMYPTYKRSSSLFTPKSSANQLCNLNFFSLLQIDFVLFSQLSNCFFYFQKAERQQQTFLWWRQKSNRLEIRCVRLFLFFLSMSVFVISFFFVVHMHMYSGSYEKI